MKPGPDASPCADKLKLLADPTRLAVLELLMDKPKHVGELVTLLSVEQSLLSHHLALLREAGLVDAVRDGKTVLYQLAPSVESATAGKSLDLGCCQLSFPTQKQLSKQ